MDLALQINKDVLESWVKNKKISQCIFFDEICAGNGKVEIGQVCCLECQKKYGHAALVAIATARYDFELMTFPLSVDQKEIVRNSALPMLARNVAGMENADFIADVTKSVVEEITTEHDHYAQASVHNEITKMLRQVKCNANLLNQHVAEAQKISA